LKFFIPILFCSNKKLTVMKQNAWFPVILIVLFLSLSPVNLLADRTVSALKFADPLSGQLDRKKAALYLIYRDDIPVSRLLEPESGRISMEAEHLLKVQEIRDKLSDLADEMGHDAPWTGVELDKRYLVSLSPPKVNAYRLRGSFADLGLSDMTKAKGATLGYASNRLPNGKNSWNSEGAFGYAVPIVHGEFIPAFAWKVNKVEGVAAAQNCEDLNISLPLISKSDDRRVIAQLKPYFQTDFAFAYKIFGSEASVEYVGKIPGTDLGLCGYYYGGDAWRYQIRLIPKVDYSSTTEAGVHTTRKKGDGWFRAGGLASLDLQFLEKRSPLFTVGAAYDFLQRWSGNGINGHEFSAYGTWYVDQKKSVGLTLKYSRGKTVVSAANVDLLTLGLELKH
jgi:hypothetical protein